MVKHGKIKKALGYIQNEMETGFPFLRRVNNMTCVAEKTLEQLGPLVELHGVKRARESGCQSWVFLGRSRPEQICEYKAMLRCASE